MLTPFKQGTILLASRDEDLAAMVAGILRDLEGAPRLTTVRSELDCIVALRLLGPSLVLLDDGIRESSGRALLDRVLDARPGTPVVYVAAQHSLDLERDVRRRGVLFYLARLEEKSVLASRLGYILQGLTRGAR